MATCIQLRNGEAAAAARLPLLPLAEFAAWLTSATDGDGRLVALCGRPQGHQVRLLAVVAHDADARLSLAAADVGDRYPAVTPDCSQAHWFEREIAEQWGVVPEGHPWLKPIRFHGSYRPGHGAWGPGQGPEIGRADFFQVEGSEVHEVAVGPVHAGVIEPGHFRFQCHGEDVFHLEISLGYQHRGIERAMNDGPGRRAIHYMETAAGDTTVGHATAHCQLVEALAGCSVPLRAQAIRAVALEFERLANHVGDLGALANDVGYLPTASYCGRLRGDLLNLTAALCGNRFGRGLVRPGGVAWDVDGALAASLRERLTATARDVGGAADLLWNTASVMARFEGTGTVPADTARRIGLVGPAARACGLARDVRADHPAGFYRFAHIPASTWNTGDVFARAYVRWLEVQRSVTFILDQLAALPAGPIRTEVATPAPGRLAVALVEGWRGEIAHLGVSGEAGRWSAYKLVDPSFHNWFGLACSLRQQPISDFPLCNKSFNLSYCGHDL